MKPGRKAAKLALVAAITVSGAAVAVPAFATVVAVGGGTWDYGVGSSTTWSHYHHGNVCHGSTAVGTYTVRSPNTPAGYWSYASAPKKSSGNQAYWRTSC